MKLVDVSEDVTDSTDKQRKTSLNKFKEFLTFFNGFQSVENKTPLRWENLTKADVNIRLVGNYAGYLVSCVENLQKSSSALSYLSAIRKLLEQKFGSDIFREDDMRKLRKNTAKRFNKRLRDAGRNCVDKAEIVEDDNAEVIDIYDSDDE